MKLLAITTLAALCLAPSGAAQCESQKLLASDGGANDGFALGALFGSFAPTTGGAVAIDGDTVLIGAMWHPSPGPGAVYVHERTAGGWVETAELTANDGAPGDAFGFSVDLEGDTAVIGAVHDDDMGWATGSAYVFERTGNTWTQTAKLVASDQAGDDRFGSTVSISGGTILICALTKDEVAMDSGSAYMFERTPNGWVETQKLLPSDGAFYDNFGSGGAVEGDTAIIGAWRHDEVDFWSGVAYVFERTPNGWNEVQKLSPSDASDNDQFGNDVAIHGDRALLGAKWEGLSPGRAYVFERTPQGWVEEAALDPSDGQPDDWFGFAVDLHGDRALIGAHRHDDVPSWSGAAYVFERTGNTWTETAKLLASDAAHEDRLGLSVALGAGAAVVGAPFDDDLGNDSGAAYVFAFEVGSNYCLAAPNSTGGGAIIDAQGCTSVNANQLVLSAAPVPDQPGLFFYGPNQTQLPFGNGFRCVDGSLIRLPVSFANAGVLTHVVDLANPPTPAGQITAGSTWNFQAWYRDPAAMGATFNASDARSVTFTP